MKELYQETKNLFFLRGVDVRTDFTTKSLGWWWTLWILSGIIGQFAFRYSLQAEAVDELIVSTVADIIGCIVGIPLALITVKIIKDYSNVEPLLSEIKDEKEVIATEEL